LRLGGTDKDETTMIRVLIIEDSPTVAMVLSALLGSDPDIKVVGVAVNGEEGVRRTHALRPDLITMDVNMPIMDGFEATRRIMAERPTPIVVVSSVVGSADAQGSFKAIQAGALDVVEKPAGTGQADFERIRERLLTTVKLMAEVKVVSRRYAAAPTVPAPALPLPNRRQRVRPAVVVVGSSTGGPAVLYTLLKDLPPTFHLPLVVVQHMASGFTQSLVDWFRTACSRPIHVARHHQRLVPGEVYFAPEDHHLELVRRGVLGLNRSDPVSYVRPSATVLFESAAQQYGPEVAGVLLTGMGDDGARGLKAIHDIGGVTLAQDEASCVVYGMPKLAVELGAVDHLVPGDAVARTLAEVARANG
jgi:two-component system chemotaxis response regulator CheB